jgi:hypothetical protein
VLVLKLVLSRRFFFVCQHESAGGIHKSHCCIGIAGGTNSGTMSKFQWIDSLQIIPNLFISKK